MADNNTPVARTMKWSGREEPACHRLTLPIQAITSNPPNALEPFHGTPPPPVWPSTGPDCPHSAGPLHPVYFIEGAVTSTTLSIRFVWLHQYPQKRRLGLAASSGNDDTEYPQYQRFLYRKCDCNVPL
jgi:hypothetical protein